VARAVVCSWLFGARFEGHGRFAFVPAWLFGGGEWTIACSWLFCARFEEYGRFAFVPAWLFGGGKTAVSVVLSCYRAYLSWQIFKNSSLEIPLCVSIRRNVEAFLVR
jgi:hypothetical protein